MSPAAKIAICFCVALLTAFIARIILGEKRNLWFKRQVPKSIITLRSQISMYFAIGTPTCRQGFIFSSALIAVIIFEIAIIWRYA